MSTATKIQWTDRTWNPVRGCAMVSPGCTNCYAMRQAHRFSGPGQPYEGLTRMSEHGPLWTGKIRLVQEALDEPLRWRKPQRIFVNSMSDLFHEDVPDQFIARVFSVMACATVDCELRHEHEDECWQGEPHTFQILTKRPERARDVLSRMSELTDYWTGDDPLCVAFDVGAWPLSNVWLGVSVENRDALERVDVLRQTPAAIRFLSLEPLLDDLGQIDLKGIDWVIIGGESGPNARACHLDWIRSIVRQCKAAGVPCFVKQLGSNPHGSWSPDGGLVRHFPSWKLKDRKGGDIAEFPQDLRVREFPNGK